MNIKTAMTLAMLFGAMVFGAMFVTGVKDGHLLMGLVSGGLIGTVSGMMLLGVLSAFLRKEDKELIQNHGRPASENAVISQFEPTFVLFGLTPAEARKAATAIFDEVKNDMLLSSSKCFPPSENPMLNAAVRYFEH